MHKPLRATCSLSLLACLVPVPLSADAPKSEAAAERFTNLAISTHVFKPHELPAPDIKDLKVANGFQINVLAKDLGNARMIAVAPNGAIYITRRNEADVIMLKDNGQGVAAGPFERVASRAGLHGISFHEDKVYLATVNEIFRAKVLPNGHFGPMDMLIHDLPDAGQHHTRTVQIGPDHKMYISVGSTCNECEEPNPEAATILRASLDGKTRTIFASGLRDTIGWGWHPVTGELWGMDHGIDWLGDDMPEEVNKLESGRHYGWPFIYADNKVNPRVDASGDMKKSEWLKTAKPMEFGYTGHAAPMQLAFYNATQFPKEFESDAFISMHGSWNRKTAAGYEVLRMKFKDGKAVALEPFVTGFITPEGEKGRPCGTAVAKDGSLLFTDDRNGILYRVSYEGKETARAASHKIPAQAMLASANEGKKFPLAIHRPEGMAKAKLVVSTPQFKNAKKIPEPFSAYEQDANFALQWTSGPAGTKSYVLIMEDPDSKTTPLPVLHWLGWNIPAGVTELRQGLAKNVRLTDPDGMRQGVNYAGKTGYIGMKPPAGDGPHHYHTQIFALDTQLDLPPAANRDQVLSAMNGHVLANGEVVGTYAPPRDPSKP